MSGYTTVPYTIAYANELLEDPLGFDSHGGRLRLAYQPSKPGDWVKGPATPSWAAGILRARVRDLRDKPDKRGPERMRKLNTRRQWRCMDKRLCQVCGEAATDPETGLISWALTKTVFERTGLDSGRTNAPPTCSTCIPLALEECPQLKEDFSVYTVAAFKSVGVLADMYRTGIAQKMVRTEKNVFVGWGWYEHHRHALAVAQVVELYGMQQVGYPIF
ncbi:hypothetical protein [Nonomuraea sp. NPDC049400]|uniref:hypothetical protein n=1 Tax=Nonomuraea sp. NPDC049400 TaxID=3364352 RepID=UPI0037A12CA1